MVLFSNNGNVKDGPTVIHHHVFILIGIVSRLQYITSIGMFYKNVGIIQ